MLWLADNRIGRVEGLSQLGRLRHLHLARNDIRSLGGKLAALSCLQMLNLADNPICHFQVGGRCLAVWLGRVVAWSLQAAAGSCWQL